MCITCIDPARVTGHLAKWMSRLAFGGAVGLLIATLASACLGGQTGQPGSDKTALLKNDLMPLLRRRSGDRLGIVVARESGVVVPFPDRRGRSSGRAKRRREIVIYFDDWNDRPLEALHARLQLACAVPPEESPEPRWPKRP